jgi:hypothetical protein
VNRLPIHRKTKLLEHQWPWLLMALLVAGVLSAVALVVVLQMVDVDPAAGGNNLRGYTGFGIFLGALAILFAFLTFLYSARKRTLQEKMPFGKATMMTWLWVHVYLGLLAMIAATFHGGFGLLGGNPFSSGKLLYFVFALLAVTGIFWRFAYRFVPPVAAPKIGNYSRTGTLKRAQEQLTEVEKIAAGKSAQFHGAKDLVVARAEDLGALQHAAASLPPADRADIEQIQQLAASRNRALRRVVLQEHYVRLLQGWRRVHVPLTLVFVVLLGVHLVGAFDGHLKALPAGTLSKGALSGFSPPEDCAGCHKTIYDQWTGSMHAHALTSPLTVAQNNQDIKTSLAGQPSPDPLRICINCHGPVSATLSTIASLPLDNDRNAEGVGCTSCHQYDGVPFSGGGGLAAKMQADLKPGRTYFGPIEDPVGNAYHKSMQTSLFLKPETLCKNCHNVNLDLNADGKIIKGEDLILQQTNDEFERYVAAGGKFSCVSCHMPVMAATRVAEGASVPFEQDYDAPPRQVHDHSFVGVDYPLDTVTKSDPQKGARAALLRRAATMHVETEPTIAGGAFSFAITITNTGAGHNLPSGFAFARQMWLEVKVAASDGEVLLTSGVLGANSDDLCDASTMNDPFDPLKKHLQKCSAFDPQLVNFQTKLVEHIEAQREPNGAKVLDEFGEVKLAQADKAKESVLQPIAGGAVARVRPSDKQALGQIVAGQSRTFRYSVPLPKNGGDASVSARLLFRNLPPYFLRAIAAGQAPAETPKLGPLVNNLQIVEMTQEKATISLRKK